jgi:RNA polymerase sigma-70 factor (ECF subfamily)
MASDEALYERVRRGDREAWGALYERWEGRLFGFALHRLKDAREAEDVLHETFMKILTTATVRFDRGSFRAWIYQIARNDCTNRLKAASRRLHQPLEVEPPSPVPDAEARLSAVETERALLRAVARLSPALAEVYDLRTAGLSYQEMAEVLGVPLGTVKSRMHETIVRLKEEMKPWTAR